MHASTASEKSDLHLGGIAEIGAPLAHTCHAFTLTARLSLPHPSCAQEAPLILLTDDDGNAVARLTLRLAGADPLQREWDSLRQNYLRWAAAGGRAAVIEAEVAIAIRHPYKPGLEQRARVGFPIALVGVGVHDIALRVRPGKVDLFVDGRVVDEEWPCGGAAAMPTILRMTGGGTARCWPRAVRDDEIAGHIPPAEIALATHELQYWTPPGHNRWAGDVMLAHLDGKLRLLYLVDRRHHGSKGGCGAHQIAQFISDDLGTWRHHALTLPIDEPWETIGTGSLVLHHDRFRLMYGLHSERTLVPEAITDGRSRAGEPPVALPQAFAALGRLPLGTAIASSDDGIHFTKDEVLVHAAQNPSTFRDPRGDGWLMISGEGSSDGAFGLWSSDDLERWTPVDQFIVPFGPLSAARNTLECPCHLAWNGWHYVIAGWRGFWMARDVRGPYWDRRSAEGRRVVEWMIERGASTGRERLEEPTPIATPRWDIYDGLAVPMAVRVGERVLLAGFLMGDGWAGCLVLRELHQEADGTLALGWMPESMPPMGAPIALAARASSAAVTIGAVIVLDALAPAETACAVIDGVPEDAYIALTFEARGGGAFGIRLVGEEVDGCELRFDPRARTAAWLPPTYSAQTPAIQESPQIIAGVEGLDRRFTLQLRVTRDDKAGGAIFDAWIDGRRTLITRTRGSGPRALQLFAVEATVAVHDLVIRPCAPRSA